MSKVTLQDITSGYNSTTKINANNTTIEDAFDNTLSRDGTSPNSMNATLDMNSKRILNLGSPESSSDAARWADVTNALAISTAVPSQTGNSGKALKTDGSNMTWAYPGSSSLPIRYDQTAAETTAGVTPTAYQYPPGDVRRYGAVGDGSTDDTAAFTTALALPYQTYVPANTYKITSGLTIGEFGLRGDGWGTHASAKSTILKFYNLTSATGAAVKTSWTNYRNGFPRLEDVYILASSWNGSTGALGYGLEVTSPLICRNVNVTGFKVSNLFVHQTVTVGQAPYQSLFEGFYSAYSGEHGIVVGTGANTCTFINPQSKWSGSTAYLTAPVATGSYDGFLVSRDGAGNPGTAFGVTLMEGLSIIGGDCSYNSRYGWNFSQLSNSNCTPGYAEGNLAASSYQANLGADLQNCFIGFQAIAGGESGVNFGANFASYLWGNTIFVGGKACGSGDSNSNKSSFLLANKAAYFGVKSDLTKATYVTMDATTGDAKPNVTGTAKWDWQVPIYNLGNQVLSARITGYTAMTNTVNRATSYDTTTITLAQLAARVKALQDDLTTHGIIGA